MTDMEPDLDAIDSNLEGLLHPISTAKMSKNSPLIKAYQRHNALVTRGLITTTPEFERKTLAEAGG